MGKYGRNKSGADSRWAKWYSTAAWLKRRKIQLLAFPLCKDCLERGLVVPATVVDHVQPHEGDYNLFVLGKLQSLCVPCHDVRKRRKDVVGYGPECDEAGWPLDPAHPTHYNQNQSFSKRK